MPLLQDIQQLVAAGGSRVGVTDLAPFQDVADTMTARMANGTRGSLGFTYREISMATQPKVSFPWGRSIVVVASPYLRDGDGRSRGRTVARFAQDDRYTRLRLLLDAVARLLTARGFQAEAVFDDDRLVDRALAQRAGVGWSGKSTMILTPGLGPWVLLGSIVTDALIPPSEPMARTCGSCDACIPACPTGALIAPGVLDARLCLSAVFQMRGDIPFGLRSLADGRIYGCDDCLTSCPPGDRVLDSVTPAVRELTPQAVLSMDDHQLGRVTSHWYVPGRQVRYIRRNALVALGNTGGKEDIGTAVGYAGHPNAMLRRHALWAVNALAPAIFARIANRIARNDPDSQVRDDVKTIMSG
ncbi:MAG: epoxyqueuosine reductase [Acidimicrobiia bacterium]